MRQSKQMYKSQQDSVMFFTAYSRTWCVGLMTKDTLTWWHGTGDMQHAADDSDSYTYFDEWALLSTGTGGAAVQNKCSVRRLLHFPYLWAIGSLREGIRSRRFEQRSTLHCDQRPKRQNIGQGNRHCGYFTCPKVRSAVLSDSDKGRMSAD